jgi:integrase
MPKPRPPFLHRQITRHGTAVWYYRQGKGPRIRIRAEFGTPEFLGEYQRAAIGEAAKPRSESRGGTLQWLYNCYRESGAWADLAPATRRQRENIFAKVMKNAGSEPFRAITRKAVEKGKDARRQTPSQARNFLDAMRGLFRWAAANEHVAVDPTYGVTNPKKRAGGGFPAWTEDDITRFEQRWPPGTRQYVWLQVLLYTGLRRGDAVRLGRQHVRNGVASLKTEKSGFLTEVNIPLLPVLQSALERGPSGDLAFICGERGQPLTKESFGNMFSAACREVGVIKSAHGVRKIGATRAAENGATVAELEAIFGWHGGGMASHYTRGADRRRLSTAAIGKLSKPRA